MQCLYTLCNAFTHSMQCLWYNICNVCTPVYKVDLETMMSAYGAIEVSCVSDPEDFSRYKLELHGSLLQDLL